ncbi:MAG: sigma E protease regulator RseP [Psychromonas sp.]|nr:sigma E protease regulator RseP [Psychromonas sp.]
MLGALWNFAVFIVALSILVAIHEFGHFWVARRCGVKVHRFSIGFGKILFKHKDKYGTEFAVAIIPLGGYVKMLDGRIDELSEEDKQFAFDHQSVWKRIVIVAAGPLANFIFAIFAFFLMYMIGINSAKPIISNVVAGSPMSVIHINKSFQVTAVNGDEVSDWEALNLRLIAQYGEKSFDITVKPLSLHHHHIYYDEKRNYTISLKNWHFDPKTDSVINSLGLIPYRVQVHLQVARVVAGGSADQAGLLKNDKLIALNGSKLTSWAQFVTLIEKNASKTLHVVIERGTIVSSIVLTPSLRTNAQGDPYGFIGLSPIVDEYPEEYRVKLQFSPIEAFIKGIEKTRDLTKLTFDTLVKLVTGRISIKTLGGPVSIAKGAGMSAHYGIEYFLGFLALISVNLGLMNLIPLPVLDGGHLLYFFVEVLSGKPVPMKIQEIGFKIGTFVLLIIMTIAIFNDFNFL